MKNYAYSFLLSWLVALCALAAPASTSAAAYTAGDIAPRGTPDGQLNAGDVLLLQRMVLGQILPTPEEQLFADVAPQNAPDGALNAGDLVVLMRAVQGLISLPAIVSPPDAPQLDPTTSPTNSNPHSINGTAPLGSEVRLYVNGAQQTVTTASVVDGAFNFSVALMDGGNAVYATTWDGQAESFQSNVLSVEYQNVIDRNQANTTLSANAVWTAGAVPEPYLITGVLTIEPGATLTIQAGATLTFAPNAQLVVDGNLVVQGTATTPVVFTSSAIYPNTGDWQGIVVNATAANVIMDYAVIEWATNGIDVTGATIELRNSTVRNFSGRGIYLQSVSGGLIENNLIELGNAKLYLKAYGIFLINASPTIIGNTIRSSDYGIYVSTGSQPVINGGNTITGNDYGVYIYGGFGDVNSNPNPTVNGNSIYDNQSYNYYNSGIADTLNTEIDASSNWWGSADPSVFLKKIWSYKNDWGNNSALARITPFLDAPNGNEVPGNFLGGKLAGDTVLQPGIPYEVIGALVVPPGATLTLQPGTNLRFASTSGLFVLGGLSSIGTASQPVLLGSANSAPVKGDWNGIVAGDYIGGSANNNGITVQYTTMEYARVGVETFGETLTATNNSITNFSKSAFYVRDSSTAIISNNNIDGVDGAGDGISAGINGYAAGSVKISGNSIRNTTTGILIPNYSPDVSANQIENNTTGISIGKGSVSEISNAVIHNGNQITNNSYGITVPGSNLDPGANAYPVVTANSIYNNSICNYNVASSGTGVFKVSSVLDATGNWWGTSQAAAIAPTICDFTKEKYGVSSVVKFSPYLDGPGGNQVYSNLLYGLITTDTVLSGDQTHDIGGSMFVPSGVALTIEPGAVLRFPADASLVLNGSINIQGTPDKKIRFTTNASSPDKGSWNGVFINGNGATLIENTVFEFARKGIFVDGGNLTISDTVFKNNVYGVQFTGRQITLSTSTFTDNGIGLTASSSFTNAYGPLMEGTINNNVFEGNSSGALALNSVGSPLISGNRLQNNSAGISVAGQGSPIVTLNLLADNGYGIYLQTSYRSATSQYYDPSPMVNNNNIQNNTTYNFYAGSYIANPQAQLDATSNWWGTDIQADIETTIYDAADWANSPTVNILPLATLPIQLAPELNNAQSTLTNTNPYAVTGTASSGINVNLYVNAVLQSSTFADVNGSFSLSAALAEGANTLYVTTERSGTESPPSNSVTVTLDTVPPTITVSTPADGAVTTLSEQVVTGSLDGPAVLTINGASVLPATDNSFSYSSLLLTEGVNVITLVATDLAGNSGQATVNLTLDTTPPAAPDMGKVSIGDSSNGQVAVSGGAGSVETGARLFVVNARSGESLSLNVAADGSFTGTLAALPGDTLSIVVSDPQGNTAPWGNITVNGSGAPLAITVQQPADGAQINSDAVTVIGTVQGPVNSGVRVNGVTAVLYNGQFVAPDVALAPGANTLTVTAAAADGSTTTQQLTVTRTGTPAIRSTVAPAEGIGPLNVTFNIESATAGNIQAVEIDIDGDGTADLSGSDISYTWTVSQTGSLVIASASAQYTYAAAGIYTPRVRVTNSTGSVEETEHVVIVQSLMGIDARLRAVYNGMLAQLKTGDISGALNALAQGVQTRYQGVFTDLAPNLATIVDQLGVIQGGRISADFAEYVVVRNNGGQSKAFLIYLIKGKDGIWRLESL